MKRLLLFITIFIFAIGCTGKSEKVVSKFIDSVKEKNIKEASKYVTDESFKEHANITYSNKMQEVMYENLFENIKYEITNVEKIDKKSTIVTVNVENLDTEDVLQKLFQKITARFIKGELEEGNIEKDFTEILKSNDVKKATNTTQFLVVKTKKGKKIELSDDNMDVIFGRYNTTINNIDKMKFNDDENNSKNEQTPNEKNQKIEKQKDNK